ncbi:hypothetical protein BDV26DRAFT_42892 [Aspergillus bertholletiae]|uniref:Uncharacterized protein n=1 Tax=Aspergillus bertholletiae TaxID=1226010 RepID=A0A5N7B019_9EURO|nr:hypothetical protein BDV26DRAFT_42892 [Aspergillus bertholletiae]
MSVHSLTNWPQRERTRSKASDNFLLISDTASQVMGSDAPTFLAAYCSIAKQSAHEYSWHHLLRKLIWPMKAPWKETWARVVLMGRANPPAPHSWYLAMLRHDLSSARCTFDHCCNLSSIFQKGIVRVVAMTVLPPGPVFCLGIPFSVAATDCY